MMNIFSKAVHYVENVAHSAYGILCKMFGKAAIDKAEQDLAAIMKEDVLQIFADGVTAVESLQVDGQPANGDQKRAAAFDKIVKDLNSSGKSLANHMINLGIELVVGLLRAKSDQVAGSEAPAAPAAAAAATS